MLKNIIDRSLAIVGGVILFPIILVLACLIRVRLGGPVLFRQTRIGRGEKPFPFLKFRTMTNARDSYGALLPDEQRLTVLGRLVRASSLDELPQLWNVLMGDMSLVGPRPLLPEYLPRYNQRQSRRHEVKPGMTGWVQVNGRNALTWEQKFDLDISYVDNHSLRLDFKILWLTLLKVLQRDGISQTGHATMPEFTGHQALPGSMNSLLLIWGAGGHGRVVLDTALNTRSFERIAFLDDDPARAGLTFCDCRIEGGAEELGRFSASSFIVAMGDNRIRAQCFSRAAGNGLSPAALVHATAVISPSARIGAGTVVMPGVIINAGAIVGEDCIINTGAVVEHDCKIESHVHISPRVVLGGGVSIGPFAHVGIGAIVLPGAVVGEYAVVGAGAVVLKEAPAGCTVVGVPARALFYA